MRNHNPDLIDALDQLMFQAPLLIPLGNVADPNECLALVAEACARSGIREKSANDGPWIKLFQQTVGDAAQEPWCLAFLQSLIAYVEELKGVTSPLPATEHCGDFWNRAKNYHTAPMGARGDIIVWSLLGTAQGHCGLITKASSLLYETVEGNTTSGGAAIVREGDGIYARKRAKGGSKTFAERGILRAFWTA